jgi:hypothetical protein
MLPEASRPKAGQIGLAFPWHLSRTFIKLSKNADTVQAKKLSASSDHFSSLDI